MRPINDEGSPAIWIYTDKAQDFLVQLSFSGDGFMTVASPDYNDGWRIHVNPEARFYRYSSLYGDQTKCAFLDYDGFRDGKFQKDYGWCVRQEDLLSWQRKQLQEVGFSESEVDDVNYTYGRRLLERRYVDPFFLVYPQTTEIVDASVALKVSPKPKSIYRLWLYFVPAKNEPASLRAPKLPAVSRDGLSVVELAYLTDREIPHKDRRLLASKPGKDVHERRL